MKIFRLIRQLFTCIVFVTILYSYADSDVPAIMSDSSSSFGLSTSPVANISTLLSNGANPLNATTTSVSSPNNAAQNSTPQIYPNLFQNGADTSDNKGGVINNRRMQSIGINDYGLSTADRIYNLPSANSDVFSNAVYLRTGLWLDRYGYSFFYYPNSFIAADNVPASSDYILGAGDQILIRGWGAVDINYEDVIDKEGGIVIPKVGRISLIGVRVGDLDRYLKNKISKSYRNFSISATVTHLRSIQVVVAGFAIKPGTYTVSSLSTLTDAIFASGGPGVNGSLRDIELKRNGEVIAHYDMYNLFLNGDNSHDVRLAPGDTIYIKAVGKEVAIYDGVKIPAIYEAVNNETIADIAKFAGGYTYNNEKKKIIVETMSSGQHIKVSEYPYATGLNKAVENGEVIHFFTATNEYINTVTLIGNVANPTRMPWHKGMRINDIITSKSTLLTKTFWNSYSYNTYAIDNQATYIGKEKTNNWANVSNNVQYSGGMNTSANNVKDNGNDDKNAFNSGDNLFVAGPIAIPEADINWHYAVIVRLDPDNFQTKLIPFDLSLAIKGNISENLLLEPGDVINVLSAKDVVNPSRKGRLYVLIDGEVNHPGVFELKPGSTLLDAINTAKGVTSDAYLYGLVLSRQSVKSQQKASMDQMLDNMQQSLLAQATNNVAQAGGAQTGMVVSQQQAMIDKLRQLKPTGRVILGFTSDDVDQKSFADIKLENGDFIHIPPTPNTVSVNGQVYNQATFIYSSHKTISDYINMAGTANTFADKSSIYVLHADGTLYNKQQAGWFGVFGSRRIYPGDAIIVPPDVEFMTTQQTLLNWTQILSNFGIAAAGITVFNQ